MKSIKYIKRILLFYINLICFILLILVLNNSYIFLNKHNKIDIKLNLEEVYLALNEKVKIITNIEDVKFKSLDKSIAIVKDGVITGIKRGTTKIVAKKFNFKKTIKVYVSDLYTIDILDNDKEFLMCNQYTELENIFLDKVLEYKIKNVGYKTRAAAVEVARFLTLEFKQKIHYFYENGRLTTNGVRSYVDGEGRFYHKGLYLSDLKKEELLATKHGPSIWGCPLYTKILGEVTPNGLDCSGFVSWVLLNAGYDVGDVGAGISKKKKNDLDDLGEKVKITKENINKIKVGDLSSRDGHIGIIIGIDNNEYYIAEALDYDLHVLKYDDKELIKSDWTYIINLDNLYKEDGILTNMW